MATVPAASLDEHGSGEILFSRLRCVHTETEEPVEICSATGVGPYFAYYVDTNSWGVEALVVYQNIKPELAHKVWTRPLHLFNSGKFSLLRR